jgi:hypothetical protein
LLYGTEDAGNIQLTKQTRCRRKKYHQYTQIIIITLKELVSGKGIPIFFHTC